MGMLPKSARCLADHEHAPGRERSTSVAINSLMTTNFPVTQLVNDFADGTLAIPEIQRDVVWKPDQVKELVTSVFRQYPCGSLIYWEPRIKDANTIKSMIRPERLEQ